MNKEKMRFNMEKNSGITLMILIVTIIIILILAGVTINLAVNKNGIFQRAANAAQAYNTAEKTEDQALKNATYEMDKYNIASINNNESVKNDLKVTAFASMLTDDEACVGVTINETYENAVYVCIVNNKIQSYSQNKVNMLRGLEKSDNYNLIVIRN